ncbi:MAG: hypothetical protein ABJA64_02085 [Candidatus Saccharibacteria bacterium]
MKTTNQQGFGIVEAVVIVVVIGIVGALGYVGYKNFIQKDPADSSQQTTANTSEPAAPDINSTSDINTSIKSLDNESFDDSDSAQLDTQTDNL